MDQQTPWVRVIAGRADQALPLVCDSPHSGTRYPADFGHAIARSELRAGEDTDIDRLWSRVPQVGGTLVLADFPRTYIDVNRALGDLDGAMLAGPWPEPLAPSPKTALGFGLIWRQVRADAPIYDRQLTVAEVQQRIERCWRPYHAAVRAACDAAVQRWGACWHLNLHSMPHNAYERLGLHSATPLADFVLGDRHGSSCDAGFVQCVREIIEGQGYRVAINDPYAGQELVRLMGQPQAGRHSLQIELNRALYMNEATREPHAGFERLRADLNRIVEAIAQELRARCAGATPPAA
ncbi:N-formylglutamate amidohydrolase [Aquabacterium sp.]|uniref:N-formylglutamate amidohydrolase n=1 Tax=Aquabacterium sp. TaxID=1872578 RepID=UPI002BDFC04A|nr:N-formylglutamate amidohydrolase [Aquabacterium sp.]HSW04687.1 N-formylglutamate amidohydrolase [Aquabacterium sp.]